jgi:hypothetical protein
MTKIGFLILIELLTLITSSCSSKLEDPDMISEDQKLQVLTGRNNILANGNDTTLVFARVPYDAGRVDITFTTTQGIFVESKDKTIMQFTDSVSGTYRYARVILRSDSTKGVVYITAETGTSRNRSTIVFN